jgi:ribonuclease HI
MPRRPAPPASARLFDEPARHAPAKLYVAEVDGGSRGNPGPAAYAVILRKPSGEPVARLGKFIGRETNNVAEYYGLIAALDYASAHDICELRVRTDSELMAQQMRGRYKVKSAGLRPLHERAMKLARTLEFFAIEHIPREQNREADALANEVLDRASNGGSMRQSSSAEPGRQAETKLGRTMRVRARWAAGVLTPVQAPELPEGAEVELVIELAKRPAASPR